MKKTAPKHNGWLTLLRVILSLLTIVAALGTLAGAYGGDYSPSQYKGICLMVMTFPAWALALVVMTVLDALWCRKVLVVSLITFIACAPAMWSFCPLNIVGPSESKYANCPKFTLMSYNVCNFWDQDGQYPDGTNPTLSVIIKADPDIVCLQEAAGILPTDNDRVVIPKSQIDTLDKCYPYILLGSRSQMLLSKYPAKVLPTGHKEKGSNEIAAFRVTIDGKDFTIFNVHLRSYNLRPTDKELYRELTDINKPDTSLRESFSLIKSQLISKIQAAAEGRELDAEQLASYISGLGGPNVIVTGDFNDVPGCYTLRRMADFGLKEVYPEVGFGPMVTFNANRFYFRIDHTLYRGDLQPLAMRRPKVKSSDHYPIISTFAITADND